METERPKQRTGFVYFGRCEICSWPHHRRIVRRQGWFKNRVEIFLNRCGNCDHTTEIWRGKL